MICPNCGENNPANFHFCGICGAVLQASKPATTPKAEPPWTQVASERKASSGPSLAGLDGALPEPRFHIEEPRSGWGRRIVLFLILAVGGVEAWRWYHGTGLGGETAKPQATDTGSAGSSGATAEEKTAPVQPTSAPPATATATQPSNAAASAGTNLSGKPEEPVTPPPTAPAAAKPVVSTKPAATHKKSPVERVSAKPRAVVKAPADESGEAAVRKGEAYLYGRGARQNCDEAIKNLKAASAKNNAKARSTLGTMYATGHCVTRDLPTAYSWFAAALRADPSNNVLEKDLSALWNQMTPPERQIAIKKQ